MGFVVRLLLLAAGCSTDVPIAMRTDGGSGLVARDECGNGLDDDGDARIDEGCYCGRDETQPCFTGSHDNRGVGSCGDGLQRCEVAESTEFGRWGACTGDMPSGGEACDGADGDCDGAIDEGCPCADGERRPCGLEFQVAPCTGGTQVCRAGSWSGCEGAIGPGPERCGDGVDDDCDGAADELCDCVPEPEICDDGTDNDCDGVTDEPYCRGEVSCRCDVTDPLALGEVFARPDGDSGGPIATHQVSAENAAGDEIASIFRIDDGGPPQYVLARASTGGAALGRGTIPWVDPADMRLLRGVKDMAWTGTHYAVLVDPPEEPFGGSELLLLGTDGAPAGPSVRLQNHEGGAAIGTDLLMVDGLLYVLSTSGCLMTEPGPVFPRCVRSYAYLDRFDPMLRPAGARVFVVGDPEAVMVEGPGVMVAGAGRIAIFHRRFQNYETGESGTTVRLSVVEGDAVRAREDFVLSHGAMFAVVTGLAFDGRRFLACHGFNGAVRCRLVEPDGTLVGPDFFDATPPSEIYYAGAFSVAFTGCRFVVASYSFACGGSCTEQHYLGFVDPISGAVETRTLAPPPSAVRPWGALLFPRADGALLRVNTEWVQRTVSPTSSAIDVLQLGRSVSCTAE